MPTDDYTNTTSMNGRVWVGGSASGNIETANHQDWFRVSLIANTAYTINLEGSPTSQGTLSDTYLRGIYTGSGTAIPNTANDDYGTSRNSRVTFTPTTSGDYYIAAGAYSNYTGTYKLSVTGGTSTPPVDSTAPTLTSLSPADEATNVAASSNIVLSFNEAVRAGSGNITITNLTAGGSRTIAVTDTSQVSFSGSTMTINPQADLSAGNRFEVTFGSGVVKDTVGNNYAGLTAGGLDFTTIGETTETVISRFDRLSVANTASNHTSTSASELSGMDVGGGFWKMFFALSSAAYVHIVPLQNYSGMGQNGSTDPNGLNSKMLGYLTTAGLRPLNKTELQASGFSETNNVHFENGFFVATSTAIGSSVATVFRSQNELFLTFRGTDGASDGFDDALNMQGHYARFSPLFAAIESYARTNGIAKINVSGHSLGGEMAAMYMNRHPDSNGITYRAVTLEAADKVIENFTQTLISQTGDNRFVNFEMSGDVVPDLGLTTGASGSTGNYGRTLYLNDDANQLFTSHFMANIAPVFDQVAKSLPLNSENITSDRLLYIDGPNSDGVIVTDGLSQLRDPSYSVAVTYAVAILADVLTSNPAFANLKLLISSGNASAITSALAQMAQEDNNELIAMGTNFQAIWPQSYTSLSTGTIIIHPTNAGTYTVPSSGVGAIAIANDNFSPSENFNINASATRAGIILVGNDGDNSLRGGSNADLIIGGGNSTFGKGDLLIGGGGNDMLYGGNYGNNPFSSINFSNNYGITSSGVSAIQSTARGDFLDDVTYMYGGPGNDQMVGSGDNDYFFIDVNYNNNQSNVDTVKSFYVSGLNLAVEDYLCFSASQLDSESGYLTATWMKQMGWTENNISIFGTTRTCYAVDIEVINFEENFFKVNGIGNYRAETFFIDNDPAFILDYSNGNLYFDADGNRDVGDQVLVTTLVGTTGDSLGDMHANQILVFPNFSFLG